MRWTKFLINTLRDDPQEAEIASHKLMLRAGMLRKVGGGLYSFRHNFWRLWIPAKLPGSVIPCRR